MEKRPVTSAYLETRIRYERLVGELTREGLARQPLARFIATMLRRLGEVTGVSRTYLCVYNRDSHRVSTTSEWVASGISAQRDHFQQVPVDDYPWLRDLLLAGRDVRVDDFRKVPEEALRSLMEREGTKSLLLLPFNVFGMPYGFIGFDECRDFRSWRDEDVELMRAICHLLVHAIEKNRWQDEMVKTERMAAMGRLAGAVAHEINNPLQSIILHLDLIRPLIEHDPKGLRNMDRIEESIRRISDIVWRVLHLYRERSDMENVDINDVVRGAVMLLERQLDQAGCAIELRCADGLPTVRGQRQLLHQAVLNIIVNAMEGVGRGGRISVSSRRDGTAVVLEIADDGDGIAEEDLPHIFEPFYSSKEPVRTGLGLFIAHLIVANHGGTITVESVKGDGTQATIRFPVAQT